MLRRAASREEAPGGLLGLFRLLLPVDQLGQLISQNLLGPVQLTALPLVHGVDLLQGQEGQHADALEDIRVPHVPPVLVELEGSGKDFPAFRVGKQYRVSKTRFLAWLDGENAA